jgi:tetratricopeptide (TPR) repeat protein
MKLSLATAASAVLFAALSMPVQASPLTFGQSASVDCAQAADAQSHNRAIESGRQAAIAACSDALNGMLPNPDRTATLANRGILEASADRTNAAIADFDAALRRDPGLADVYVNRGAALLRAGRYAEARADFDHAIAMNASSKAVAYFDRGMANEKSGDVQAAYRDYSQAHATQPDFQPALIELARFHPDRYAENR